MDRLSVTLVLEAKVVLGGDADSELLECFGVTLDAQDLAATVDLDAMVSKPALWALGVDQMQDPSCFGGCASAAVAPPGSPVRINMLAGDAEPILRLQANGSLEQDVVAAINTSLRALMRGSE